MKTLCLLQSHFLLIILPLLFAPLANHAQRRDRDYFPELNQYYSTKPLGATIASGQTVFRLFAPNATAVTLVTFPTHDAVAGTEYPMQRDADGVWEFFLPGEQFGLYYGYRVHGPKQRGSMFDPRVIVADPYARAVVTQNTHQHPAKSLIVKNDYDWEGDSWTTTPIQDLIIYEMHVRDMTAHPSAGIEHAGTYPGLVEPGKTGGLNYLLDLGINAVELLPCQEFANIEPPFNDTSAAITNTWNPYSRNHWGYMTSYFFAPESYYATDGNLTPGGYCGIHGRQVTEFKDMVKALHRQGIAVIMDVVYNHVSDYDLNPFKFIDKKYYFRQDSAGRFLSYSGCGNDFMTERPMARRLILESVAYWMTEYHIDGFRFDLAYLIDEETCRQIAITARAINPNVYLIAEPWGGGYGPDYFSRLGWSAWNDKIRNGVKGQNPFDNLGFIFGRWERENKPGSIRRYISGTLVPDGGLFLKPEHAVNYLESHDDHTLGDFVRLGSKKVSPSKRIADVAAHVRLTEPELKIHRLAALFLLVSQGVTMIHAGQEFARSKVIASTAAADPHQGQIDHNSYNKDNETNWIDYEHRQLNRALYDYYRGLIALRKAHPALRRSPREAIHFLQHRNPFALGFWIDRTPAGDPHDILVLMNADPRHSVRFQLPPGSWSMIVDGQQAGIDVLRANITGQMPVAPTTGLVLIR